MMLAYINLYKPKAVSINIEELIPEMDKKLWETHSPNDVLKNPNLKLHKEDSKRIENADLSYPIIVTSNKKIIDGAHRLTKAYKQDLKTIKAYIFDKELLKKFILTKNLNYEIAENVPLHKLFEIFAKQVV